MDTQNPVPDPVARSQSAAQPMPQVGQQWTHRPGLDGRTVTVTGISQAADHLVIAYEWRDDGPGQLQGAVPLEVFHRVYEPEQPDADTLPQWLYRRFDRSRVGAWADLSDDDRSYWAHEAAAVRRAVARGGFKTAGGEQA